MTSVTTDIGSDVAQPSLRTVLRCAGLLCAASSCTVVVLVALSSVVSTWS